MSKLVLAKSEIRRDANEPRVNSYSPAIQDYLRTLHKLSRRNPTGDRITTSQLAARLAIRPASVTAMLQKMAAMEPALVDYHKNRGARLTPVGERAALSVVRCHRLLEMFLHEKLGYGWDEVHEEADCLEHVIGEELTERLSAALGHPLRDPHGHAIPTADLTLEPAPTLSLRDVCTGRAAVVQQVRDDDPALLRHLDRLGLRPGVRVSVIGFASGGALQLGVGEREVALDLAAAEQVFVTC